MGNSSRDTLQNIADRRAHIGNRFRCGAPNVTIWNSKGTIDVEDGRQKFFHGIVFLGLCNRILGTFEVLSLINCIENHQMLDNMLARVSW